MMMSDEVPKIIPLGTTPELNDQWYQSIRYGARHHFSARHSQGLEGYAVATLTHLWTLAYPPVNGVPVPRPDAPPQAQDYANNAAAAVINQHNEARDTHADFVKASNALMKASIMHSLGDQVRLALFPAGDFHDVAIHTIMDAVHNRYGVPTDSALTRIRLILRQKFTLEGFEHESGLMARQFSILANYGMPKSQPDQMELLEESCSLLLLL
jgi:hypothetical protein